MSSVPSRPPAINDQPPPRQYVLRFAQWESIFEFSRIFRSFRQAIQPTCLLAALAAITIIYTSGRLLDLVWGPQVLPGEITAYVSAPQSYYRQLLQSNRNARVAQLSELMETCGEPFSLADYKTLPTSPRLAYARLCSAYEKNYFSRLQAAPRMSAAERRIATGRLQSKMRVLRQTVGTGIFAGFLRYETRRFSVLCANTLRPLTIVPAGNRGTAGFASNLAITGNLLPAQRRSMLTSPSVVGSIADMVWAGPVWLVAGAPPLYRMPGETGLSLWLHRGAYVLSIGAFLVISLIAIALAGAVISRRAMLTSAGRPADWPVLWRFARRKLFTFILTPLLPFLTILGTGLVLTLLALPGAIPFLGEIFIGVFFVLFLLGGFLVMLMLLGLLGGFMLMYPTIAAEDSDSFDAISRSFSYVYAAPWRLAFYSLLGLVYGVITNLFVSFALFLLLAATHLFLGWGMNLFGHVHGWYSGEGKLDTIWPAPVFGHLSPHINWWAMSGSEFLGAQALYFWLFLTISLIGAYTISYFFCANSAIYLLIRRHVDGQPPEDIADIPAATQAVVQSSLATPTTAATPSS
jgi:hypothetical protein